MSLNEIFTELAIFKSSVNFEEIEELDIASKSIIRRFLENIPTVNTPPFIKLQAVLDYAYEKINIGNWREVETFMRKTMTLTTYVKLLAYINTPEASASKLEDVIKELFKIIDFGLLFGCPLDSQPLLLQQCASILNAKYDKIVPDRATAENDTAISTSSESNCSECQGIKIEVANCPSMETFYNNYIVKESPVLLNNCINHWPALKKWKDQNYLIKLAGLRTVPVELGAKYTDAEWTQKLMTLEEFIKDYIYNPKGTIGYLAQYQLFDHIPELKNDISEPEYCCFYDSNDPIDINAWYGPKGTVSPLHFDQKKNLLVQVIGEKKVYLFSPKDTEYVYPHEDELLHNTARVDPREPNLNLYPKYKDAKAYFCVLRPGQMLYIPPKWWHFVESLSISFSVSFWWN